MPRREIQIIPGEFYHVLNRGNARQDIFYDDKDRYRFLQAMYLSNNSNSDLSVADLEKHKGSYTLAEIEEIFNTKKILYDPFVNIYADCLMPNHFHLFLQEIKKGGIANFMQRLGGSFGKYTSIKYDRPGSLFQGRYKIIRIKTDDQFKYLLIYINVINPAQLIEPDLKEKGISNFGKVWEGVENYKWSTHQEYMNRRQSILINRGLAEKFFPDPKTYCDFAKGILYGKYKGMQIIDKLTLE